MNIQLPPVLQRIRSQAASRRPRFLPQLEGMVANARARVQAVIAGAQGAAQPAPSRVNGRSNGSPLAPGDAALFTSYSTPGVSGFRGVDLGQSQSIPVLAGGYRKTT